MISQVWIAGVQTRLKAQDGDIPRIRKDSPTRPPEPLNSTEFL
jgi:hypothetical protein